MSEIYSIAADFSLYDYCAFLIVAVFIGVIFYNEFKNR